MEATVKKEIIVKRLSAFKFAVEVNTKSPSVVRRQSVIQKAPPAIVEESSSKVVQSQTILIRHAVLERIVEMLLCKLLGQTRLEEFCGYPESSTCSLLSKVLRLSRPNNLSHFKSEYKCNGSIECFLEQVAEFLKICAPNEQTWNRFGWFSLSEEAILRKIFVEELSPNMKPVGREQGDNIIKIYEDTKRLLQWEQQGFTTITMRQPRHEKIFPSSTVHNHLSSQISHLPGKEDILKRGEYQSRHYNNWTSAVSVRQTHPLRIFPYPNGENNHWYVGPGTRRGRPHMLARHY